MTDNRTTELREKLTEHGVKWWPMRNNGYYEDRDTEFVVDGKKHTAHEWGDGLAVYNLTPKQAVVATLGADDGTRWYELFGTPERAEKTLNRICSRCNDDCDNCSMFKLFGEAYGESNTLEWLRGKVVSE